MTGLLRAAGALLVLSASGVFAEVVALTDDGEVAVIDASGEVEPAKPPLSPPQAEKYAEFLKKLTDARRQDWAEGMAKELATISQKAGLTAEQAAPLQAAADQAVEAATAEWVGKVDVIWRKSMPEAGPRFEAMLKQATNMIGSYVKESALALEFTPPRDEPAWREGLQHALSSEQFGAWQAAEKARKGKVEQEVAELLRPMEERVRASVAAPFLNRAAEMRRALALDKERGEKLDVLARAVADQEVAVWRKGAMGQILSLTDEERQARLKNRRLNLAGGEIATAERDKAWSKGLAAVLTPEELGKLGATKSERRARREKAMGEVMVQVLDERFAFTSRQRELLRPLAERLIRNHPVLFRPDSDQGYYSVSTELFCTAAAKATDEELRPILDETQFRRWREICRPSKGEAEGAAEEQADGVEKTAAAPKIETAPEADDFENTLSDFLFRKGKMIRQQCLTTALLRAEEAGRVCGLSLEALSRLQTAARGAAEASLRDWRRDCEQNVRSNLEGSTGPALQQRLAGMEEYYFMRQSNVSSETQPVWAETLKEVKSELTPEQQSAMDREDADRTAFRTSTIIHVVMADFDQRFLLSAEQYPKLETLVRAMLQEYGGDIAENFANNEGTPWYLQSYYKFIPIAGVPEKALKETLTKEQIEGWMASREYSSCAMYWTNLEQNHARRQKQR